jgi:hypothetical protein
MSAKQSYKKAHGMVPIPKAAKRATPLSRILQEAKKHTSAKNSPHFRNPEDWKNSEEWDFSKVPKEMNANRLFSSVPPVQTLECLLYEAAREKLRRSDELRKQLNDWYLEQEQISVHFKKNLSRVKKSEREEMLRRSEAHKKQWNEIYAHFDSPFGHTILTRTMLEEPWFKLIEQEKKKAKSKGKEWKYGPLGQVDNNAGKAAHFQESVSQDLFINYWKTEGRLPAVTDSDIEFGCFFINWNYPDSEIKRQFEEWLNERSLQKQMGEEYLPIGSPPSVMEMIRLNEKREQCKSKISNRIAKHSQRGHVMKEDRCRADLKKIGAYRLVKLAGMKILQAAKMKCRDGNPIFKKEGDWEGLKRKVDKIGSSLFSVGG